MIIFSLYLQVFALIQFQSIIKQDQKVATYIYLCILILFLILTMKQSITSSNSLEKKFVGRKDKEKMRQLRKKMEEEQKRKKQIQQAEMQLKRLKQTGLVAAYNQFLKSLVLNGLPPPSLLYEQAASYILKYEKKIKLNEQTKEKMEEFNKQILKKSRSQQKQKFSPRKKNKKNWDILIPQGIQKQKQ